MSPSNADFSEDTLVEQPAIQLLGTLGWPSANCFYETFGENSTLGRINEGEVVLTRRLKDALKKLNPKLPPVALGLAVEELTRDRRTLSPVGANREVYNLLKYGVEVEYHDPKQGQVKERVRVIDWENAANNDYFLASQFWVHGQVYRRRADLVGFINGLLLVFIELKATHRRLENAYNDNLRDYKDTIPQLFWYNALIILSNGSDSRVGSMTAGWEHFAEWKKINSEGEKGIVSLETMLRGTCDPKRLLDLAENFTLFHETKGGVIKLLAMNHQYLGVNNAIAAVQGIKHNQGKLGVFWHTQGSGKSFSMVFFGQKVLRKLPGNWTFVVITDRDDLDGQIYKNFANTGAVTEAEERVRADSGQHLRQLLQEDHRYVFTLIHKFNLNMAEKEAGVAVYPVLSKRSDVIVMTDEAHRSQYDTLALNMRSALPHAAFIGFTGTPLIKGEEERTREVFGDYVSIYNFQQSAEDKATVPLFYENRIPELQLTNKDLNADMERLLEEAELDERQEKKLEREFARQYHLITRDERLDKIAEDVVTHFVGRGFRGKAMFIAIDKVTAVRMFNKVKDRWAKRIAELKILLSVAKGTERESLTKQIAYMESTDMAVVVSQAQNEVADFQEKGLDILPHRLRMLKEDLETKFKDPDDPFRLVRQR
jgi:type I restriction enzyme R subunit